MTGDEPGPPPAISANESTIRTVFCNSGGARISPPLFIFFSFFVVRSKIPTSTSRISDSALRLAHRTLLLLSTQRIRLQSRLLARSASSDGSFVSSHRARLAATQMISQTPAPTLFGSCFDPWNLFRSSGTAAETHSSKHSCYASRNHTAHFALVSADDVAISEQKRPHLIFQRRKIHLDDQCNCVDGSDCARVCGNGAGGERTVLRFSRLLRPLQRVLTIRAGS